MWAERRGIGSRGRALALALLALGAQGALGPRPAQARPKKAAKAAPEIEPVETGLWGLRFGDDLARVKVAFSPDRGESQSPGVATWAHSEAGRIERLAYTCTREMKCRAVPSKASFDFLDGRLAAFTLTVEPASAPRSMSAIRRLDELERALNLGRPIAQSQVVGRLIRYFGFPQHTLVWIKDGPETQIKAALDAQAPIPRAEAVAAGADEAPLMSIPGALAYAQAQGAIASGTFSRAAEALDQSLAAPKVSPLLAQQARLVLAMTLAARVKTTEGRPKARAVADLSRAMTLAPGLAPHLQALAAELKLPPLAEGGEPNSESQKPAGQKSVGKKETRSE